MKWSVWEGGGWVQSYKRNKTGRNLQLVDEYAVLARCHPSRRPSRLAQHVALTGG